MRIRRTAPGPNRRRFLAASAAGLAAAGLTATGTAAASASPASPGQAADSLTEAVLAASRTHRLVGLGETHGLQEHHDLLQTLLADPRLPGVVNDIVIETGNALYQDTVDAFVLDGRPVNDADLRPVWRNTTQSPNIVSDSPVYEQLIRRVRAVNWALPPGKRIRVLLGDPPFDWSKVTSASQIPVGQRNTHPVSVVKQQVLAKGRRALIHYGSVHLLHTSAPSPTIVSLLEQQTGMRAYVIYDLIPMTTDPGGVFTKLAAYPRGTVIPTAGTWLGQVSAGDSLPGIMEQQPGQPPKLVNPWCGTTLGQQVDAGLYLGQAAELTASPPNPAVYLDPGYWAELQRRNAIEGNAVDLNTFRQQQPPAFPLSPAGPAC